MRRDDAVGVREIAAVVVARGDADTRHTQAARSGHVGAAQIADVQRSPGRDAEWIERRAERARLAQRPSDALFDTALEVMKAGLAVFPDAEREERIREIVAACTRVAEATGGGLAKLLGMSTGIVGQEAAVLDAIGAKLRSGGSSRQ